MKSNICKLNGDLTCLKAVLAEVEKVTTYNGLEDKKALRLRLLAEELCGMLPGLIENFSGEFWAENDGYNYELHVNLKAEDMNLDLRDELISVSKSGKNAAAKGVMGKIRAVAETMLLAASDPTLQTLPAGEFYDYHGYNIGFGYIDPTIAVETGYIYSWSLFNYKTAVEEKEDEYAELERSIVAKIADDIIVGVRGKNVEIIVKKSFDILYDFIKGNNCKDR